MFVSNTACGLFLFLVLIGFQIYLDSNTLKKDAIDILAFGRLIITDRFGKIKKVTASYLSFQPQLHFTFKRISTGAFSNRNRPSPSVS